MQKVCDGVLLRHPEGFLVGLKQQPGTSSHPPPSRLLLAPDPLIRVSVITPPATPLPLPKTEIALSTQDSNSQHRGSPQKSPPQKFLLPEPPGDPSLCVRTGFQQNVSCCFFLLVLRSREPLAGWGALERWLPVHPDQRQSSTTRRAQHMCRANAPTPATSET